MGGAPDWVFFKQGSHPSNEIAAIWKLEEIDNATKEAYFAEIRSNRSNGEQYCSPLLNYINVRLFIYTCHKGLV